jgi:hypothetical protein
MIEITRRMIQLGQLEPKPLANLALKAAEEMGELAEAVNHLQGFLPHKKMKEPIEGEVADVINCVITVLIKAYPNKSAHEIYDMLEQQLIIKADKWEKVIWALED